MKPLDDLLAEIEARAAKGIEALDDIRKRHPSTSIASSTDDVPRLVAALREAVGWMRAFNVDASFDVGTERLARILSGEKP